MSRSSPGRYALHEFAKNVYGFKATNSKGEELDFTRTDPYSWKVQNTDGEINIEYILFGNRGDGTYSQIDETHAHLNIPATFMYAEDLKDRPIEVDFDLREDLDWKVATQLKKISGTKYSAPDLYYFMDSPTEISNWSEREFEVDGQTIKFVLHHLGTEEELDQYFDQVQKNRFTGKTGLWRIARLRLRRICFPGLLPDQCFRRRNGTSKQHHFNQHSFIGKWRDERKYRNCST